MKNVSYKSSEENRNIHFMFKFLGNRAVDEVIWKNSVGPDMPQVTI